MQEEYNTLMKNKTWTLVPKKADMKVIGNKWVFRLKYGPDGRVQRHRARLVAKCFLQTPGIDFSETFSPIIKASTFKFILILAVSKDWEIRQVDVNNDFLNGELYEADFMNQP